MVPSDILHLPAFRIFYFISVCLIFSMPLAVCVSIDEVIEHGTADISRNNFFQMSSNHTIEIKTELDIVMPIDQYKKLHSKKTSREKRKGWVYEFMRWPDGIMIYSIADSAEVYRPQIRAAADHWQKYTCLKLYETTLRNWGLVFTAGDVCQSYIGNTWSIQNLQLHSSCGTNIPTIIHEIGHAVGFVHEHSRPDRDQYVRIDFARMVSWAQRMFEKKEPQHVNTYDIPYDYTSIMHYGSLGVMTTLDPAYQNIIGNSPGLSFKDIKLANLMYNCHTKKGNCEIITCPFNGFIFFKEFKGMPKCTCFCDSGNISDPLVPCSAIDREVPGPNIQAASSLVDVNKPICVDMRKNCTTLQEKGVCLTEINMMSTECKNTCGFCEKGNDLCMDYDTGCKFMASTGACKEDGLEDAMSKLCAKSCNLCAKPSSSCEIEQAFMASVSKGVSNMDKWNPTFWMLIIALTFAP